MNNCRIFAVTSLITTGIMLATSCTTPTENKPDAISGATYRNSPQEVILPPETGEYRVLGVQKGLKNYVIRYDDTVFRGGEPYADSAAQALSKIGINSIISITPTENERQFCRKHGFTLIEIPFKKVPGPAATDVKRYIDTIKTGAGPFYVHCHGGTHRGGVLGVAYRVHILGWPYEEALVEYGRLGGDLLSDHTMLESVRRYQE